MLTYNDYSMCGPIIGIYVMYALTILERVVQALGRARRGWSDQAAPRSKAGA